MLTPARAGLARSGVTRANYPITFGAQVPLYAISNVARSGATRSNYTGSHVFIDIGGVPADDRVMWAGASLSDTLDETPTTGNLTTFQFHPVEGQEVLIRLGSRNNSRRLFAGTILAITRRYEGKRPANAFDDCRLIDYTWGLGAKQVRTRYLHTSVAAIVANLVATYAPGYTWHVETDIGAVIVDEITFTETTLPGCLTQLTRRVGGSWQCDYQKVVQVFFENTLATNPRPLNAVHPTLMQFTSTRDLSQIVTRVLVEGGGVNAFATCAVGESILPLDGDPGWYPTSGGTVVCGPQRITYTGVSASTGGGMVGPGAAPSGAPVATLASGAGVPTGTHSYAITFTTASGESLVGPTVSIAVGFVAAPVNAPTIGTTTAGVGPDLGAHSYAVTYVTASGETTAGPTVAVTTGLQDPPETAPTVGVPTLATPGVEGGLHEYAVSFLNPTGETTAGPIGPASATAPMPDPTVAPTAAATGGSELGIGVYSYGYTFVSNVGETRVSPASAAITTYQVSGPTVACSCTSSPAGSYPSRGPGSGWPAPGQSVFFRICNFDAAGGQSLAGGQSNTIIAQQGGGAPGWTANMQVNFPAEPSVGVAYRLAYMYVDGVFSGYSGGGTTPYGSVGNVIPPGATYQGDVMGSFGGQSFTPPNAPPTVAGAFNCRGSVSGIAVGPAGTIARKIYRTAVNGSTLGFIGQFNDNTTTSYIEGVPDASRGPAPPTVNTAGVSSSMPVQAIPTGPSGTTGRKLYRRSAGGTTPAEIAAQTAAYDAAQTAAAAFASPSTANYNTAATDAATAAVKFQAVPTSLSATAATRFQASQTALQQAATDPANATYKTNAQIAVDAANSAATAAINEYPKSLRFLDTISNNSSTTYTDRTPSAQLGAAPPATTTATLSVVHLAAIPTGGPLVTGRKVYRSAANTTAPLKLVATLADNTATTYIDTTPDASLGATAPGSNTATANQIDLTAIPVGAAAVTTRKIYRTAANQTPLKLLATLADNTTRTYHDAIADVSLGAPPPATDTSGLTQPQGAVVPGSTSLQIASIGPFPPAGWAVIGNGTQVIRYTGISGNVLTGIPASGPGSIEAAISYNSTVTAAPVLTGIPASGTGSIRFPILRGDEVNLLITVDDPEAQAALAALIGGDGIHESYVQDRRLSSREATARGRAHLELKRDVGVELRFQTRDINTRAGATIAVNLGAPFFVIGDFLVQDVTIEFIPSHTLTPVFTATASSYRLSFEDLLRAIKAKD